MKTVMIASPREPSGVTWLINCFLSLGICSYRENLSHTWKKKGDQFYISEEDRILKKWLPILSEKESFNFIPLLQTCWTHSLPKADDFLNPAILFVRDPRDAFYSLFKRELPSVSYSEFVNQLDPDLLLDRVSYAELFFDSWTKHPNLKILRFEDYKRDPYSVLIDVLQFLGLTFSNDELKIAIEQSTSERAQNAERRFSSKSQVNQGGVVGRWRESLDETSFVSRLLSDKLNLPFDIFGYEGFYSGTKKSSYLPMVANHPCLSGVSHLFVMNPPEIRALDLHELASRILSQVDFPLNRVRYFMAFRNLAKKLGHSQIVANYFHLSGLEMYQLTILEPRFKNFMSLTIFFKIRFILNRLKAIF